MLGAMAAGTVAVLLLGARWSEPSRPATPPARPHETPWLSPEAAAQIIGPGGSLGPLFAGTSFGEPVPAAVRSRIAAFARANHVAIDLEDRDDELAAIRFEVSYSGCCGYEGVDVLALRLARPYTGGPCLGGPETWVNDWALMIDEGTYVRARVRVNRLVVRWERAWSAPEVVEHADELVGQSVAAVRARLGDRWFDLPVGALIEAPFVFPAFGVYPGSATPLNDDERGIHVLVEHGRIAEVSFVLADRDASVAPLREAVRARWGRPRTKRGDIWKWRTPDRSITADVASYWSMLTIRAIGATSATP
jgi:hypothetical protein